jgi:hypothetical protein
MRHDRRLLLTTLCAALLGLLILQSAPAGKGKPGGEEPPPPPPLPPSVSVRYAVKTFGMPADQDVTKIVHAYQMTSTGMVVGDYTDLDGNWQAFLYDPARDDVDNAVNLNDIGIIGVPAGWRIASATDINEFGFVVGPLENLDTPGRWRGYLLDLGSDPPMLTTLPDGPLHTYSRRINDSMDILGVYQNDDLTWGGYVYNPMVDDQPNDLGLSLWNPYITLNNPDAGQSLKIVGRLSDGSNFRKTLSGDLETFADLPYPSSIENINASGDFCGSYAAKSRGQNRYTAFRYLATVETFTDFTRATAINGHKDLALIHGTDNRPYLYHEGTGAVPLDNIVDGSDADLAAWITGFVEVSDMTERGAINSDTPDFPGLCGDIAIPVGESQVNRGFVLIPIP